MKGRQQAEEHRASAGENQPTNTTAPAPVGPTRRDVLLAGTASLAFAGGAPASAAETGTATHRGQLVDRVVMVTGAARGIGRAISVACAQEGANVVGVDIASEVSPVVPYPPASKADLAETASQVEQHGKRFMPLVYDVRDANAMRHAVQQAVQALGHLDVVVANAAIMVPASITRMSDPQWYDVIDVNINGTGNTIRAAAPHMVEQGRGSIVVISSVAGRQGVAYSPQYSASKWAVIGLTKSVALELASHGITVNAVCPTAVDTPMFRNSAIYNLIAPPGAPTPPPERMIIESMKKQHPLNVPWVEPVDVARAVVFLASDDARYVSGAVLDVTAGTSARYTA